MSFEKLALEKSVEILTRLMPTMIAVLDRDLMVHYVNDTMCETLGFSLEEACTKRCFELTNKPRVCPNCAALKVFATGKPVVSPRTQTSKTGELVYFENHDVPVFGADGKIVEKVVEMIVNKTSIVAYQKQLEADFLSIIETLVTIIASKDIYTRNHSFFVKEISVLLGERMGLDAEGMALIRTAALLHDVGKVGIPYSLLNKKERLTDEEFARIKEHPAIGSEMVSGFSRFKTIDDVIRHHHERYDGNGYPDGLAGEDIPFEARIIAAADSYHAMASRRAYKDPYSHEYIAGEFVRCRGTQFDPAVADVMLDIIENSTELIKFEAAYVHNEDPDGEDD